MLAAIFTKFGSVKIEISNAGLLAKYNAKTIAAMQQAKQHYYISNASWLNAGAAP